MFTDEHKKEDFPGKAALFLGSVIIITLMVSYPIFSILFFVIFPMVFQLMRGRDAWKQLIILFLLIFIVCMVVFANAFFIYSQFFLFLLASLFFTILLGSDLFIAFYAVKQKCAILLIFGYVVLSRFILSYSTAVFPFYWTLTMHLLPFMGMVSRFVLPLFWEALCMAFSAAMYLFYYYNRLTKNTIVQAAGIVLAAIGLSGIAKAGLDIPVFEPGLECALVQGGYSRQDYALVERYPALSRKIAQRYLDHIGEITGARFVVLPESAFPLYQTEESEILQTIKDIARSRNEYIMTGILLEEDGSVYNASALINPEGQLQNVYRKRNTVLFVETSTFTKGIRADNFAVDGHIIAPVICFESLFIRNYFRDKKPELYIVISNDIFAEKTVLSSLHQAYGVINARTMRTPLLQAMQNGPSFYVDSQGELTNLTMPYEQVIGLMVEIR
jgi:apolipoprotein N-acyltransferase